MNYSCKGHRNKGLRNIGMALLCLYGAALVGCAGPPQASFPAPQPASAVDPMILIGDVIRIGFSALAEQEGVYHFDVGDRLEVRIQGRPDLSHQSFVVPDGTSTFPLVGTITVQGRTIAEIAVELTERYTEFFSAPHVDVLVIEAMARINQFMDRQSNAFASGGALSNTPIGEEGLLHLPLIGPILALGRPLSAVRQDVVAAYAKAMPSLSVRLSMVKRGSRGIAVLGEVNNGGVFEIQFPISPLRALALAGGLNDRAYTSQILHIRTEEDGTLTVTTLDLKKALEGKDGSALAVLVKPNDVIFVRRTRIANANLFVDQYIRRMLPVRPNFGIGYDLNN